MATWNKYDKGDLIRCTGTFTDAAGTAQDPAVVLFSFTDPSANTTTYTYTTDAQLVRSATGVYYVDVDADESGTWRYRFYSTGTGQASEEFSFQVEGSYF